MTLTEQDMEFVVQHHEFLEGLWEPRFGDLILCWDGDEGEWGEDLWCVIGRFSEDAVDVIRERDGAIGAALIVDCALLPSQRQLEAMLEEKGYLWDVGIKAVYGTQDKYRACAFTDKEVAAYLIHTGESWSPTKAKIIWTGPDPETALLRALIEVMNSDKV